MKTPHRSSDCRIISIATARAAGAAHTPTALAQLYGQRSLDLAGLSESIRADRDLTYFVTETACIEFGWPWLSLEEAIVLLGARRLRALLLSPTRRGRTAGQLRRTLHQTSIAPTANLCPPENIQGEIE